MNWASNKVFRMFVLGVLIVALYAKLSSPTLMIARAEDATVVLKIVKKVPVEEGPLLPILEGGKKKHLKKENRVFLCSGYIADDYGHIVTAAHCVEGGEDLVSVTVYLHNTRDAYAANVILKKPLLDIALIQASLPRGTPYMVTRDEYEWPGTHTYAIGHPLGLFYSVSDGIVSGYAAGIGGSTFVQITDPINPGNSGGPIINDKGEVVGVCSFMAVAPWGAPANGLGFAVPAPTINVVMSGHLNHY